MRRSTRTWTGIAIGAAWLFPAEAVAGTLADAAAALEPGTWTELATNDIEATLTDSGGSSGNCLGYADELKWDSVTRRLMYIGMDHNQMEGERFVAFREDDATWVRLPVDGWMAWSGARSHAYDHQAIDTARRFFYFRHTYSGRSVYRHDLDAGSWTQLEDNDELEYAQCCGALEYFPELDGIVWVQGGEIATAGGTAGGLFLYQEGGGGWTRLGGKGVYEMGSYHNFAEYMPGHGKLLFGGGNEGGRKLYALDGAGTVTALADPPIDLGIHQTVQTADPASGELLVLTADERFFAYDPGADTWAELPAPSVPVWTSYYDGNGIHAVVAAPIETYGVVAYLRCESADCRLFLYRHAEGAGVPPPTGTGGGGAAAGAGGAPDGQGGGAAGGGLAGPSAGGGAGLPADGAGDGETGCACGAAPQSGLDGHVALALAALAAATHRRRRR